MKYKDFFNKEKYGRSVSRFCSSRWPLRSNIIQAFIQHTIRPVSSVISFLDNLPVVNMNAIIIEGALFMIVLSVILLLREPKYILFAMKAVAIFIAIRAFFVAATHLGIYPDQIVPGNGFLDRIYVGLDLQAGYFFSAHTGLPFLMALIFWDKRFWRYFYFVLSGIFGAAVLARPRALFDRRFCGAVHDLQHF